MTAVIIIKFQIGLKLDMESHFTWDPSEYGLVK